MGCRNWLGKADSVCVEAVPWLLRILQELDSTMCGGSFSFCAHWRRKRPVWRLWHLED